ncbi:unnamed protein product [Tilletia controversa]|uniref:Matrin-type domain-containing protein n=3 Tax=Tilletia TaxID=13289 RepID=A0A8X7SUC4_9BASI|nr:hypothetical protein CF328_g6485 [Tilletia controversa]KAE8189600.1 hypothetical protein CF336_g5664 [Tilletia laevis]KAE8237770.1 hypothetical protein A4X03_0g9042 [Tilletia caries]KAE8194563.1 hypothetical protein CF335_g5318 [Tilletia laevis]KAE8242818.1 hypothetical protein A4X06_0g6746 [Tilletia controversa]
MDYQNRAGNKGAGVAGASEANVDRRERLRRLALETIDLAKDPYILRNHLGSLECRLCLTLHTNEGSYLAHTQGKKHQTNLARRAAKEAKDAARGVGGPGFGAIGYKGTLMITGANAIPEKPKKRFNKIGRPGYNVTKIREPLLPEEAIEASKRLADKEDAAAVAKAAKEGGGTEDAAIDLDADADADADMEETEQTHTHGAVSGPGGRQGLLFQVQLPLIAPNVKPLHRFMSSFEQTVEPQSRAYQYLVVAAEPYETIAFKIPSRMVERKDGVALPDNGTAAAIRGSIAPGRVIDEPPTWSHWSPDSKTYTIQVIFR